MTKFQDASVLGSLRSRSALGIHVAVFIAAYPALTGLLAEAPPGFELGISIHLYDLIGSLTNAAVILLARQLLLTQKREPTVLVTLTSWLSAAFFGVLVQITISSMAGPVPASYVQFAPVTALVTLAQLFVFHRVSSGFVGLREASRDLSRQERLLNEIKSNLEARIDKQNYEIANRMRSVVLPLLDGIRTSVQDSRTGDQLSQRILAAVDETVRPLSHQLGEVTVAIEQEPDTGSARGPRTLAVIRSVMGRRVRLSRLFAITTTATLLLVFVVPTNIFFAGLPDGLLQSLPACALILCGHIALGRAAGTQTLSTSLAIPVVVSSALISAATLLLNLVLVANPAAAEYRSLIALQAFLVVLSSQTLALILDARWSTLDARRVATRELERLILKLQVASNLQARRLGHIVHGRVQAQLQAIALQLHGSEPTPEQLTSMAAALEALGSELENDAAAQQSLVASIDAFKNLWDGLCEITVTADDGILEALESDQAKANAALVVIEESITNAVKHASAEQIEVRIDRDGDEFNLIITNDVNRTLKPGSRGFGSKTYAAMARDWSLDVSETRAILRATL